MHKKESVTLSSSFFLHTHCSVLCKTKYSYQTNVQKTRIPTYLDSASFSLHKQWNIFPSTARTHILWNCLAGQLDSHLTRWNNFFLSNIHANTEHVGEPYHSFFFNQPCSVKCFYSDWLKSQPVKLPRFSPPSLDETRYNSKLFLNPLAVKPFLKKLGIQVSFSSCFL